MAEPRLVVSCNARDFFREELGRACASLNVTVPPSIEFYVVSLLSDFSVRDPKREAEGRQPLALLLEQANRAAPAERMGMLKGLGDSALYMAGFFAESIERSLVDVEYYVAMGTVAYQGAASLSHARRRSELTHVFYQLASKFAALVDVLNYVAAKSQGRSGRDTDLLKLYERYVRTGNERTRKILTDCGLSIQPIHGTEAVH